MIIERFNNYAEKPFFEELWLDSNSVSYTRYMPEDKIMMVLFKSGTCYKYFNVESSDYVSFSEWPVIMASKYNGSHGKTFAKFIKNGHEYEKLDNSEYTLEWSEKRLEEVKRLKEKEHTYFISGHRDITDEEFKNNYIPEIAEILENTKSPVFIMGDYHGADIMAQNYLLDIAGISSDNVIVYHMGNKPNKFNDKVVNFKGGFNSDEERDSAMTKDSIKDIAFVRNNLELSGTAMNILRRKMFKK